MSFCFRMLRTLIYMLLLIHFESCGYYAVSAFKGLDKDRWVYDGQGIAYVDIVGFSLSI